MIKVMKDCEPGDDDDNSGNDESNYRSPPHPFILLKITKTFNISLILMLDCWKKCSISFSDGGGSVPLSADQI